MPETPIAWLVTGVPPEGGEKGSWGWGYATLEEAEHKAAQLRAAGWRDVEITPTKSTDKRRSAEAAGPGQPFRWTRGARRAKARRTR